MYLSSQLLGPTLPMLVARSVSNEMQLKSKTYSFTSAKDVTMSGVCLLVCLLATLRKNYWTDLREKFITDVSVDKEVPITFWK